MKYVRIWGRLAVMSLLAQLSYRLGSIGFLLGKLVRLLFFFAYIVAIFTHTQTLAGYTLVETVLFFLTFNLVDITAQIFFRGIYGARRVVVEGDLDYYLVQPCSPLFRMACTTVDFLDVVTMLPVLAMTAEAIRRVPGETSWLSVALFALLTANGVAIAFAIHVFVAALAVRTQELDNTIWLYRDMMFLGKFPADIYNRQLQAILIFLVPIAVMTTFPAKALLGRLDAAWTAYAFAFAALLVAASLWFWRDALRRYTSVSS